MHFLLYLSSASYAPKCCQEYDDKADDQMANQQVIIAHLCWNNVRGKFAKKAFFYYEVGASIH